MSDTNLIDIAMIGPVPSVWGGRTSGGGGVATHIRGLITALPPHNVRVRLLADNTDAARADRLPTLREAEVYPMVQPRGLHMLQALALLGPRRIGHITTKILSQPHLRHAAPMSHQLKFIGQAANFDKFLTEQPTHILHVHHAEYRQYLCQQVLGTKTPLVATVHGVIVVVRSSPAWLVSLITANYRRADWLIAVSSYVKEVIIKHGADPSKVTIIPNGVDIDVFSPDEIGKARKQLDLPMECFIVLFTGSLKPWKGVDVLLKAFQQCVAEGSRKHLIVIGAGPERENLGHLVTELGIADQVTFVGYRPFTEMPLWYQACDVLVLPSRAEGFGLTALEAMSCGKPAIVSSPLIGEHDFVEHGETGLLVDYGDANQLAHALDQLASSPELARHLGTNARKLVEQNFSWDIVGRKTVEVYRTVLAERERRR